MGNPARKLELVTKLRALADRIEHQETDDLPSELSDGLDVMLDIADGLPDRHEDARARAKKLLDEAQQRALARQGNRDVLLALANR